MKKLLTLLAGIIPIGILRRIFLKILGHEISLNSRIGLNLLFVETIIMKESSKIGYFNIILNDQITLDRGAFIKHLNLLKGPFTLKLQIGAGISKQNKFRRASNLISEKKLGLTLGMNSFIVSNHFFDVTKSITIGKNSIIAGIGTQLWTHGYYHADTGKDRIRIDGKIQIGDNVYIGSGCIFNPGVKVGNAIHVGSGSVVSKDLEIPGMYVSQGLRHIENSLDKVKSKLKKVKDHGLVEPIYKKE